MNHEGLILERAVVLTTCSECSKPVLIGQWLARLHHELVHEACWRAARAAGRF